MRFFAYNLLLGLALLAVPLMAEALAGWRGEQPGVGIRLMLYWPFDYCLMLAALVAFLGLNIHQLGRQPTGTLLGVFAGFAAAAVWIGLAVLLVLQVHIWRGGVL